MDRDADIRLLTNYSVEAESYTDSEREKQIPTRNDTTSANHNIPLETKVFRLCVCHLRVQFVVNLDL